MKIRLRYLLVALSITVLTGCSLFTPQPYPQNSIIDLQTRQIISREQLIDKIIASDYVVLGEKHDNPQHHALQLWILQQLTAKHWLQQLSMEMITPLQQQQFTPLTPAQADNDTALQKALAWPTQGWPWQDYKELVRHAVKNAIPLQSANIDREQIMALYQGETKAPDIALSESARIALLQDIEDSHCGQIHEPQTTKMLAIQLTRDHAMAQSLLQTPHGGALIAGAFHARKDFGFPLHLSKLAPEKTLLALALFETNESLPPQELEVLAQQYDVVWVTAEYERGDPCADFPKTPNAN